MIMYANDKKTALYDGVMFTRDKTTGYYLSTHKIGGRRRRLHVYVYEHETGCRVPDGYEVHHKDFDKGNNEFSNLVCITSYDHHMIHAAHRSPEQIRKAYKNLIEKAQPEAIRWHRSGEGRKWHKKHAAEQWAEKTGVEYTCDQCGKTFTTRHIYGKYSNHFCSNSCKSAYRRASGVDDVDRECVICGEKFRINRYQKQCKCPSCRRGGGNRRGSGGRV